MPTRAPKKSSSSLRLNAEQQSAVLAGAGAWAVISGPGSGKSTCLLARYVRLVEEGTKPDDILSVTFTAEAAKTLRNRAEAMGVPEKSGERVAGFLTFHSVALSFAQTEGKHFPFPIAPFPLATDAQTGRAVLGAARRFGTDPKLLRSYISQQKRTRVSPAQAVRKAEDEGKGEKYALAYKAYDEALREMQVLDFDALLTEMVALLEKDAKVRARWQYKFVMADECQDLDELQFALLKLLTEKHGNVYCVGDPGQGIYGFRAARPDLLLNLAEVFPGAKTLYLARNHRSSGAIVSFCKQVGPVPDLAEKFHTSNPEGQPPEILKFPSAFDEASEIVRRIKAGEVSNPESVCILARTNLALRVYEDALSVAGIRYRVLARAGFYEQPEIRSLLAYVQCVNAPYDNAVLGALRAPFEPTKFLRKKEIADTLLAEQKRDPANPSIWKLLHGHAPSDMQQMRVLSGFKNFLHGLGKYRNHTAQKAVEAIIHDTRAEDYYAGGENNEADNSPSDNLTELLRAASRFRTVPEFLDHVRKIQGAAKSKKGVTLSTAHSSKGGEWDDVFLTSCAEGVLPHKNCGLDVSEEARVFFVAVSRAAKRLTISYSGTPSRFLAPFIPKERDEFFD